jgi:serine/threonine protein kinase
MTDTSRPEDRFSRIEAIYHQALERPEEERPAFLSRACAGDDHLRREVENLLSFDGEAGRFMESPALNLAAQAIARNAELGRKINPIGQTILHYKVLEKIGEGGMGVVYRALDTHLHRPVAIKILPPDIVTDRDRRLRFVQEARAASALNHPNIITIHDIDQVDGTDLIAMEYVSGKTLAELIPRKGMKLTDALKYSIQIADALAAAHAAGIVHRDLKPANVMVTETGLVKVLDFGLAKLTERTEPDASATTETLEPRTEEGTILGTVTYMSPEQAEGKKVDARSDIFSFGSVLYEMVTGQKAFQGESRISTLSAILHQEPKPVSGITPTIPADLEKLINRCLRKDPAKRWQTMADLKVALDELKEDSDSGRSQVTHPRVKYLTAARLVVSVFSIILIIAAGWYWLSRRHPTEPESPLTPVPLTTYSIWGYTCSFSPDGTQVAFSWNGEKQDNFHIYIKQIGVEPPSRLTTDPAEDFSPAWSPDGQFIAFLRHLSPTRLALAIVPQRGGQERVLEELDWNSYVAAWVYAPFLTWTPDSKCLVLPSSLLGNQPKEGEGLILFSIVTSEKRRLTTLAAGTNDTNPAFSPDGRTLAFTRCYPNRNAIYFLQLGKNYEPQGEPPRLATEGFGAAWTPDGTDIVFCGGHPAQGAGGLWRMAATMSGKPVRLGFGLDAVCSPAVSVRGNRLAYAVRNRVLNLYHVDLSGPDRTPGIPSRISSNMIDYCPTYSPNGKKISFHSTRSGAWEIWVCDSDGSSAHQLTSLRGEDNDRSTWSPDGHSIAFGLTVAGRSQLFVMSSNGGLPRSLMTEPIGDMLWPFWSRDGQSIYFRSKRSGSSEIWKMPAAGGEAVQITPNGDERDLPQESPDGRFLYYMKADRFPDVCSVWRVPSSGGKESKVIDSTSCFCPFAVGEQGIYYLTPRDLPWPYRDKEFRLSINFYDSRTGKTRKILELEKGANSIAASADGASLLYTQNLQGYGQLMLVENFR